MEISWFGQTAFKIKTLDAVLIIDPFDSKEIGLPWKKQKADILAVSNGEKDTAAISRVEGEPYFIFDPGEYEVKGVDIYGVSLLGGNKNKENRKKALAFIVESEDLTLCHLGGLNHKLDPKQLEELNGIDILMIPVGGEKTIGAEEAAETVSQIEPSIVIPMYYQLPNLKLKLGKVDEFLEEMGVGKGEEKSKLDITHGSLPEETEVVVLKPGI